MLRIKNRFFHIALIGLLSIIPVMTTGCGGGTVGTGTGGEPVTVRSIEGTITYTDGEPVANATITIIETGENTKTNAHGEFAIETTSSQEQIQLEIATSNDSQQITVDTNTPTPNEVINVKVSLDPVKKVTTVNRLAVRAQVQGKCDAYFENGRYIRQSLAVRDNTACEIGVRVKGDGRPLARIPFVVQHSDCKQKKWVFESEGVTDTSGIGTAGFTFFNTEKKCFYRIVVPYNVEGLDPTIFLIYTFHAQSLDASTGMQSRPSE